MQCKVLIVDDEYIMRQGIRHMIEWEKEGYLLVGEAADGEEGLAMIQKYHPDIVLADIVMPVLDGMDFSMIVKKRFPYVKLVILSGYDNFEYVKQTLLNGACDYVLKPTLNPQTLLALLEKTAARIPGICLEKNTALSINEKLCRYLGGYDTDLTDGDFRQRFPYTKCRLLLSKDGTGRQGEGMELTRFLQDYWNKQEISEAEALLVCGEICVVLLNCRIKDENAVMQQATQCVRKVHCLRPGSFWVYGEAFDSLSQLSTAYQRTVELAEMRFYYRDNLFLCATDSRTRRKAERFFYERYAELLKYHSFKEALTQIREYASYLLSCTVEEYLLKNTIKNLLYNYLREKEKADGGMAAGTSNFFRKIDQCHYMQDFWQQITQILDELDSECMGIAQTDSNFIKIQQYIQEHYAENLELVQIAKQFNYNYNYLSTYFKRKMQEGFSEYLNRVRIEKACELLKSTPYSIAQVSEMVGYSDPSYFTRIFKNQTGRTPTQWKRRAGRFE